ncbi:MAG: hypothetical protein CL912_31330 [Deltaproteobacteria bacterium]|nr:hypothetical protein [Deltaproteobacteria bacterium]
MKITSDGILETCIYSASSAETWHCGAEFSEVRPVEYLPNCSLALSGYPEYNQRIEMTEQFEMLELYVPVTASSSSGPNNLLRQHKVERRPTSRKGANRQDSEDKDLRVTVLSIDRMPNYRALTVIQ